MSSLEATNGSVSSWKHKTSRKNGMVVSFAVMLIVLPCLATLTVLTGLTQAATAEKIIPISAKEITLRSMPFANSTIMRGWWEPLREHIYAQTGLIVRISLSPDYVSMLSDSAEKRYDLYLVSDHFIPLLASKHAAKPLVAINVKSRPKLIYHKDLGIKSIVELRNKCIAMPHEIARMSILAKEWLATQGLSPIVDYQVVHLASFQKVAMKVLSGQCDAGIITSVMIEKLTKTNQAKLTAVDIPWKDRTKSGISILARGNIDLEVAHNIQNALLSFGKTHTTAHHLTSPLYAAPTILDQKMLEYFELRYQSIQPLLIRYLPPE